MKENAKGFWYKDHYDINLSSIYTELIKQAAKCESYSSDILYDIKEIEKYLHEYSNKKITKLFGFRDCGVDSNLLIEAVIEMNEPSMERYRTMYKMTFDFKYDELEVVLEKCPSKKLMEKLASSY